MTAPSFYVQILKNDSSTILVRF